VGVISTLQRLWSGAPDQVEERDGSLTLGQYMDLLNFGGFQYPFVPTQTYQGGNQEAIADNFLGYVQGVYQTNGVVFACMLARMLLFSEARFQFRRMQNGRPGELFGTAALGLLETPWPGGTTGDLLSRAIQDVDLAGNFYATRYNRRIQRLRPDWVTIILGSYAQADVAPGDLEAEVLGYLYSPGGPMSGRPAITLQPDQVAHFAPVPDPTACYRGMSWLTPVMREIMSDGAASTHKLKFFEHGATPNMVVTLDAGITQEAFTKWIEKFRAGHEGVANAYKTLYLAGGADAKVVGTDFRQMDFKTVQGAGETRIAAAAGVPPVIVGLSEGLQAATYSNYAQARRRFADGTMRPLWRNVAGSLARIISVPAGAELWYDDRDIPFLQEDQKDAAEIQQAHAQTMRTLIDAGFAPDSVTSAVISGDLSRLVHTGLYSVQLQPPQTTVPALPAPAPNGKTAPAA
jgi:phage portal protein BeeE